MFRLAKFNPLRRINLIKNIVKMNVSNTAPNRFIETIATATAPKAIGPYSQGKIVNKDANLVYTSGSLGIDPSVLFMVFQKKYESDRSENSFRRMSLSNVLRFFIKMKLIFEKLTKSFRRWKIWERFWRQPTADLTLWLRPPYIWQYSSFNSII